MTEQQYILCNGGDDLIGQSIFMQSSHASRSVDIKDIEALNRKLWEIVEKNTKLRQEFRAKVAAGEIHKDTQVEELLKAAAGHEDNEATHAARRCLQKRGIAYDCL